MFSTDYKILFIAKFYPKSAAWAGPSPHAHATEPMSCHRVIIQKHNISGKYNRYYTYDLAKLSVSLARRIRKIIKIQCKNLDFFHE